VQQNPSVTAVAHVIQLSVAPVFLLSGIGAMLSVMTSRLGRVIDRARALEHAVLSRREAPPALVTNELSALARRATLISWAITLCTVTALLVCSVIAVLFVGAFLTLDTSTTVALLFITAMAAFVVGLLLFLREILLATATVQIGIHHLPSATNPGVDAPDRVARGLEPDDPTSRG
jgi:hypothetical protein